jgi:hypothetical protein
MEELSNSFSSILGEIKGELTLLRGTLEDLIDAINADQALDDYNSSFIDDDDSDLENIKSPNTIENSKEQENTDTNVGTRKRYRH